MKLRTLSIILLILFAVTSRFIPHPPNFTPVIGVGLFAGVFIARKVWTFLVPIIIMFLSDAVLGFHSTLLWVYISLILVVLVGHLLSNKINIPTVLGGSIGGAVLFFIITNFGVWITGGGFGHPATLNGLFLCYLDGIPFFINTLSSTILYSGILFGVFLKVNQLVPSIRLQNPVNDRG